MTDNVITFPVKPGQQLQDICGSLQSYLDENKVPKAAQKRILDGMSDFLKTKQDIFDEGISVMLPDVAAGSSADIKSQLDAVIDSVFVRLAVERFNREVWHCRALGLMR